MKKERVSCDCTGCKSACKTKPGWFLPGEPERVAEFLKITPKELFDNYLAADWYSSADLDKDVFVLSPAVIGNPTGALFPFKPTGTCVFLDENGSCKIHSVAPFECKEYIHSDTKELTTTRHKNIALEWKDKQESIKVLLGSEPEVPLFTGIDDILSLFEFL